MEERGESGGRRQEQRLNPGPRSCDQGPCFRIVHFSQRERSGGGLLFRRIACIL